MLTVHVETFGWEEQIVHGLYMQSHVNMSTCNLPDGLE